MSETIKPVEGETIHYGSRPKLRRTLEQVKLVVEDGRRSVVAVFREGSVNKPDESEELTIAYESPQELDEVFLSLWGRSLESADVFKIRLYLSKLN